MTLHKLGELNDWELEDSDQDVRGRRLRAPSGEDLGLIKDLMVDLEDERVVAVVTGEGEAYGAGGLEIRDDCVLTHERPISGGTSDYARSSPAALAVWQVRVVKSAEAGAGTR